MPDNYLKNEGETTAFCEIMNLQIQGNNLKRKQNNHERRVMEGKKIASHPLSEADKEFLWSLGHLGKHSAQALVNANFKNATEHLSLHGN